MAELEQQGIVLQSQKGTGRSEAVMRLYRFGEAERRMRAIRTLLLFWLIAAVSVLIPIAHFILVPGFLIGGVVAARRVWHRAAEGVDVSGGCPACGREITIDLEKQADLPQWHDCPHCGDPLELAAAE
ncbi:MAG: hypothetical protein D6682_01915 [Zetaproteobacteria bacterium]|nr:MAG: hypothetical protein D6682_01915 [Zetaproteobacteria bacterium]